MRKGTRRLRNSLLEVIARSRAYIRIRQLIPQGPGHSAGPRSFLPRRQFGPGPRSLAHRNRLLIDRPTATRWRSPAAVAPRRSTRSSSTGRGEQPREVSHALSGPVSAASCMSMCRSSHDVTEFSEPTGSRRMGARIGPSSPCEVGLLLPEARRRTNAGEGVVIAWVREEGCRVGPTVRCGAVRRWAVLPDGEA